MSGGEGVLEAKRAAPVQLLEASQSPATTKEKVRRSVTAEIVDDAGILASASAPAVSTSGPSRIRRMDHEDPRTGAVEADAIPAPRIQRFAAVPQLQREGDDRAAKLKALDDAANAKRMAHARDEYLFDKSLGASDEALEATNARLAGQRTEVTGSNDVSKIPPVFALLYQKNPELALQQFGYASKQAATIRARMKDAKNIPKPSDLLPPGQIAAHLGKFANGAHAFIDPSASKKIEGEITDERFKGWGIDANFVAPLDEANALNAKAHKARGIETIEDELGIPSKYWSKSAWNPAKELVRWVIPKPKLNVDAEGAGVLLEMATGQETGADSKLWVAGGLTKGGASEAVLKAIPREQLMKHLADGAIRQKTEVYPETADGIQ